MMRGLRAVAAVAACLVPDYAAAQAAQDIASGCFVHAFAREQFRPPVTTYTGPRHEPLFMEGTSSLIVGPGARLLGFARERYRKQSLDLGPDARVPDIAALGFDRRVDSFKVACVSPE